MTPGDGHEDGDGPEWAGGNFRAEDLSRGELESLTVLSEREQEVLKSLESPGQRLLIGPRGSGKSTYLKLAYYRALDGERTLPVYVNYQRSISLEPEFHRSAKALPLFRQWLHANIIVGAAVAVNDCGGMLSETHTGTVEVARGLVSAVERLRFHEVTSLEFDLASTIEFLLECAQSVGRRRVVLLLDDAAHAFSPEQQREFFEVFAALRSRNVSAKAAVYPGVTSYTPRFHLGHDAQLIDVWLQPERAGYLEMFDDVASRRLPPEVYERLSRRENLMPYLAFAAFGIPRTFIAMLAQISEEDDENTLRNTKSLADDAIADAADSAHKVFLSLESKLPRYRHFVEIGTEFVDRSIEEIRQYNESRAGVAGDVRAKNILVKEPIPPEILRVLGLLEYAGVVRTQPGVVFDGSRASYRVVVAHYAFLLSRNALALGRNPSVSAAVNAMVGKEGRARVRRTLDRLLGRDFLLRCRLDLGACSNCGTRRENPEARFCSNCGARLEEASVYDELIGAPIDRLPISERLLERIKENSEIRTIKDVLLDDEGQTLLKVKYIGGVRASRIRAWAEDFVYE